jgi:GntR family transcriptional regulator, arabinose operon transcriptional repressor
MRTKLIYTLCMPPESTLTAVKPKYQKIYDALAHGIRNGDLKSGQKIPSEAALVKKFGASRITVGRAVRELQQSGLVKRIAGSGTYVHGGEDASRKGLLFGLIIPDLGETEIFEPICQGIAGAGSPGDHALMWGHASSIGGGKQEQALQLCRQCIDRHVSGVFFAPLEFDADDTNKLILNSLRKAKIPVVLLDRRPDSSPDRYRPDLVGIDNHRAGFLATEHLIRLGARHIAFVAHPKSASTVRARIAGYRDALLAAGRPLDQQLAVHLPKQSADLKLLVTEKCLDAFVCANDRIAGHLMRALPAQDIRIPGDVRIVGIDDVNYASLLPVPLTTIHQPCREIGAAALEAMLDRLDRPAMPARDILLNCELVVRDSCGAASSAVESEHLRRKQ